MISSSNPLVTAISQGEARLDNSDDDQPYLPINIKVGYDRICQLWQDDAPVHDFNAMQHANARLIVETFNVVHETGKTPRELAAALEAEKAAQEALAVRLMGQAAYDNAPCQAHPLELVEQHFHNQLHEARQTDQRHREIARLQLDRLDYALEQIGFYFAGTEHRDISSVCLRVLQGESLQDIRRCPEAAREKEHL